MKNKFFAAGIMIAVAFQSSVYAKISCQDFAELTLKKHSMEKTFDVSELSKDSEGAYLLSDGGKEEAGVDVTEFPIDPAEYFKEYHFYITSAKELEDYDGTGITNYFQDEIRGTGVFYRLEENSTFSHIRVRDELYFGGAFNGLNYTGFMGTKDFLGDGVEKALAVVDQNGMDAMTDASLCNFSIDIPYTTGTKNVSCHTLVFQNDRGEYVIPYSLSNQAKGELEEYQLYPVQDFLKSAAGLYKNAKPLAEEEYQKENGEIDVISGKPKDESNFTPEKTEETEPEQKNQESKQPQKPEQKPEQDQPQKTDNVIKVLFEEQEISFPDQKPILKNNRVLVPMRTIFELLGADVIWDGETKSVTAQKDSLVIRLTLGENKMWVNDKEIILDTAPQLIGERTLVPLRAVAESFQRPVSWEEQTQTVNIQ